ncbi:hypothetical protein B0H13DRAFT_2653634 [Mycena leptocephala]|nr:hypothetical protein B0H13DRAFT_2653634 [Mycena leptocephala]
MPKNSRRKEAALRRERDKDGEIDPKEANDLAQDGNYIAEDAPPANSDTDMTPSQLGERIRNLVRAAAALLPAKVARNANTDLLPNVEINATSRKQHAENNDLIDRPPPGQSASTLYRERNGKTQKGRAKAMQRSVLSFFSKLAPKPTTADNQDSSSDIEVYNRHFFVFITLLTAFLKIISGDVPVVLADGPSEMAAVPVEETETGLAAIDIADEPAAEPVPENPAPSRLEPLACEVEMTSAQMPEPPTVAAAARPTPVINPAAPAVPLSDSKAAHAKPERLIEKHIRLYRKPKTMLTDTSSANFQQTGLLRIMLGIICPLAAYNGLSISSHAF